MSLEINSLKPAVGSTKKRKRVGRGNASGHGTYSCKGLKGQKSRSGVSGLKRLGMRQVLLRTPKKRGFISLKGKDQVINISLLNLNFKENEEINPKTLFDKKLIDNIKTPIKVLGQGELKVIGLKFTGLKLSNTAKEQIEKMKGQIN
jgi:large subunit ribosomal protein L15